MDETWSNTEDLCSAPPIIKPKPHTIRLKAKFLSQKFISISTRIRVVMESIFQVLYGFGVEMCPLCFSWLFGLCNGNFLACTNFPFRSTWCIVQYARWFLCCIVRHANMFGLKYK
jgi:hypothetical protein